MKANFHLQMCSPRSQTKLGNTRHHTWTLQLQYLRFVIQKRMNWPMKKDSEVLAGS